MKLKILVLGLVLFILLSSAMAQKPKWVVTFTNGEIISTSLLEIEDDSLHLINRDFRRVMPVASIAQIRKLKRSKFWIGSGIGFVVGAVAGALIGHATYERPQHTPGEWDLEIYDAGSYAFAGGVLGGLIGFGAGGIFGLALGKDELYDLSKLGIEQKIKFVRWLVFAQQK